MTNPVLYYFAARGRAELIRLILAEAGVVYQEHPIGHGTPPVNGLPTDFAELKKLPLLPFGAVPVWQEPDGFVLAQSAAIAGYLGRKHGLYGNGPRQAAQCDQMLGAYDDVRTEFRKLYAVASEGRPALRSQLVNEILPRWFGCLDRIVRANRDGVGFVVGEAVSVADLALWYLIESAQDNGFGAAVEAYPTLVAFAKRIAARPRLAAYLTSPLRPVFAPLPS